MKHNNSSATGQKAVVTAWYTTALAAALVAASLCAIDALGQDARQGGPAQPSEAKPVPLVNADEEMASFLRQAQKLIEDKRYDRAIEILQAIISRDNSGFYAEEQDGVYTAIRLKAVDVLGSMPPEGLRLYRALYDPQARKLYEQAAVSGDIGTLRRIATDYAHSSHGPDALDLLGSLMFDRGEFDMAARCWAILGRLKAPEYTPVAMTKQALALHLGGRSDLARKLAAEIAKDHPAAKATLGGRQVEVSAFLDNMLQLAPMRTGVRFERAKGWPGLGGIPSGLATMDSTDAVLVPRYVHPGVSDSNASDISNRLVALSDMVTYARNMARNYGQTSTAQQIRLKGGQVLARLSQNYNSSNMGTPTPLPASLGPVVVDNLVVYRSDRDVTAFDIDSGKTQWTVPLPLTRQVAGLQQNVYYGSLPNMISETGRYWLTAGEGKVYATFDYLPAVPQYMILNLQRRNQPGDVSDTSGLVAIDVASGEPVWQVGRGEGEGEVFQGCKFVSPPTYADGKLYVVARHLESFTLLCLDAQSGQLLWNSMVSQLPTDLTNMSSNMGPMENASPPAVQDGRVFVVTNSGVIAGFDAQFGQAMWAFQYGTNTTNRAQMMRRQQTSGGRGINPTIVLGGRLICLPVDSESVMALNVDDGSLQWQAARNDQSELSALPDDRLLLSGPGILVISARDGSTVHDGGAKRDIVGRPAVTSEAVFLSGAGAIHRMLLSNYATTSLSLMDADGLVGNLIAVDNKLLAANVLGVCAYFSYQEVFDQLTETLEKAPANRQAAILLDRGQISYNIRKFGVSLSDLDRAAEIAAQQGDEALLYRLRIWQHRAHVSLGANAKTNEERLGEFLNAMELAQTDLEKGHMAVRLAKTYQALDRLAEAADVMERLGHEKPDLDLVDVGIGPEADVIRFDPEVPTVKARVLSLNFTRDMIDKHGRDFYASFDAQAQQALDKAREQADAGAILDVASRWPNARCRDEALWDGAQLAYLNSRQDSGQRAKNTLARAVEALSTLATTSQSSHQSQASLALALIYDRQGRQGAKATSLRRLASIDADTNVTFADFSGNGRQLFEKLSGGGAPASPAPVGGQLVPKLRLSDNSLTVLRDADNDPLVIDGKVAVIAEEGMYLRLLDPGAKDAAGTVQWEALLDLTGWIAIRGNVRNYVPNLLQYSRGTLSSDGKVLAIAAAASVAGFDVRTGKRVYLHQFEAGTAVNRVTAGDGAVIWSDYRSRLVCLDAGTGKVRWEAPIASQRPVQLGGGMVVGGTTNEVFAIDLESGRLLKKWQGRFATASLTRDGLLVVKHDDGLEIVEKGFLDKPLWSRQFKDSPDWVIATVGDDVVLVQPKLGDPTVQAMSLIGGGNIVAEIRPEGEPRVCITDGLQDGSFLGLLTSPQILNASNRANRSVMVATYRPGMMLYDLARNEKVWSIDIGNNKQVFTHQIRMFPDKILMTVKDTTGQGTMNMLVLDRKSGKSDELVLGTRNSNDWYRWNNSGGIHRVGNRFVVETPEGVTIYGVK